MVFYKKASDFDDFGDFDNFFKKNFSKISRDFGDFGTFLGGLVREKVDWVKHIEQKKEKQFFCLFD